LPSEKADGNEIICQRTTAGNRMYSNGEDQVLEITKLHEKEKINKLSGTPIPFQDKNNQNCTTSSILSGRKVKPISPDVSPENSVERNITEEIEKEQTLEVGMMAVVKNGVMINLVGKVESVNQTWVELGFGCEKVLKYRRDVMPMNSHLCLKSYVE